MDTTSSDLCHVGGGCISLEGGCAAMHMSRTIVALGFFKGWLLHQKPCLILEVGMNGHVRHMPSTGDMDGKTPRSNSRWCKIHDMGRYT